MNDRDLLFSAVNDLRQRLHVLESRLAELDSQQALKPSRYVVEVFAGSKSIWRRYFDASGLTRESVHQEWPQFASVSQIVLRPVGENEVEQPLVTSGVQPERLPGIDVACFREDGCDAVHDCDGYHSDSPHYGHCCHDRTVHAEPKITGNRLSARLIEARTCGATFTEKETGKRHICTREVGHSYYHLDHMESGNFSWPDSSSDREPVQVFDKRGKDYVCPQCGPDPEGEDKHADKHMFRPSDTISDAYKDLAERLLLHSDVVNALAHRLREEGQ